MDDSSPSVQGFVADPQGSQVLEKVNAEIGFFMEMRQSDVESTVHSDAPLPEGGAIVSVKELASSSPLSTYLASPIVSL